MADTKRWVFAWPEEILAREVAASSEEFASWLRDNGRRELTRRQLTSLYYEFIEITETCPLSWGRFDRSLRGAGIRRERSSTGAREYRYCLVPSRPKLVASTDLRTAALSERRKAA